MRTLLTILFVSSLFAQAQEEKSKLKGHRISFVPLTGYFVAEQDPLAGLPLHVDATFHYKKQQYKLALNSGFEIPINIIGEASTSYGYLDLGVLYGREWPLIESFYVDGYVGASFFAKIVNTKTTDKAGKNRQIETYTSTLGVPLQVQIRRQLTDSFSVALCYHGNINHLNSVNSFGLAFGFRLGLNKGNAFKKTAVNRTPSNRFSYHSFQIGGQTLYPHGKAVHIPVSGLIQSVSFIAGKHLFKCRYAIANGTQLAKSDDTISSSGFFSFPTHPARDRSEYQERALLYGRAFRPISRVVSELYTGLAHINYTNQYHDIDTKQLGVAVQTTLNIYLTKTFALNLTGGLTLSNKHSNRYWGATLRWNAKRFKYFQS